MAGRDAEATLRALLRRRDLRLSLALPEADLPAGALDAPVRWVHSSDLADPTPFLADDLVLLTTGTQWVPVGADTARTDPAEEGAAYTRYVERLSTRGVRGLGFGTEVVRAGIPPLLVDACRDAGMPLFEVPYRTPFIAVARANAEAIAAQAFARRSWALVAQRALSLAALRPDGVGATVAELSRQLGAWTGLFDGAGQLVHRHPGDLDPSTGAALSHEVDDLLRRGAQAAATVGVARAGHGSARDFTVQTLGPTGRLRGALAIATTDLDHVARGVVTAAVATISLALAQQDPVERARRALHRALARALLAGDTFLPTQVLGETGGALPADPVVVARCEVPIAARSAEAWLQSHATAVFVGEIDDGLLLVLGAEDSAVLDEFAERFDVAVGVSAPAQSAHIPRAADQARLALRHPRGRSRTAGALHFADAMAGGILSAIAGVDATAAAQAVLAPLHAHDTAHGTSLVTTLHAWLDHDCANDVTAQTLGVHRHTVRARLQQAEQLLGVDLASFPARAELWTAFALSEQP